MATSCSTHPGAAPGVNSISGAPSRQSYGSNEGSAPALFSLLIATHGIHMCPSVFYLPCAWPSAPEPLTFFRPPSSSTSYTAPLSYLRGISGEHVLLPCWVSLLSNLACGNVNRRREFREQIKSSSEQKVLHRSISPAQTTVPDGSDTLSYDALRNEEICPIPWHGHKQYCHSHIECRFQRSRLYVFEVSAQHT